MRDVAVIGAGPVGATLAALAAGHGLDIAVFEARPRPSGEERILALSAGSREILEEARAWPVPAAAIASIHISQKGGPGRTLLEASEQSLPALGYTVTYAALENALAARLGEASVPIAYGASCREISLAPDGATVRFDSGDEVAARLLVLADGGVNAAKIPGIAFSEKDYEQRAVTGLVAMDRPHHGRAYERFTPQGPVALLPVGERFAFVWTAAPREAERLLALDDARFLSGVQAHFGDRAGRFMSVEKRAAFPLKLRTVNVPVAMRTVQLGEPAMLDAYRESRRRDAGRGVAFTDFLVSAFADGRGLPTWGRGLALAALDLIPPARRALATRMIHGAAR